MAIALTMLLHMELSPARATTGGAQLQFLMKLSGMLFAV